MTSTSPLLTFDDIKKLKHGDAICIPRPGNPNGPERWRVNGELKTWVTQPERFELPMKRGLYEYGRITNINLDVLNELHAYIETPGVST